MNIALPDTFYFQNPNESLSVINVFICSFKLNFDDICPFYFLGHICILTPSPLGSGRENLPYRLGGRGLDLGLVSSESGRQANLNDINLDRQLDTK